MGLLNLFRLSKNKMTNMEKFGYEAAKYDEGPERLRFCKLCYRSWLEDPSQVNNIKDFFIIAQTMYNLLCFNCRDNRNEDINATALAFYFATRTIHQQKKVSLYGVLLRIYLCDYVKQLIQNLIINMLDEKNPTNKFGGVEYREYANAANLMIMYYDITKYPKVLKDPKVNKIKLHLDYLDSMHFFDAWCENSNSVQEGGHAQYLLYNYLHQYYFKGL